MYYIWREIARASLIANKETAPLLNPLSRKKATTKSPLFCEKRGDSQGIDLGLDREFS